MTPPGTDDGLPAAWAGTPELRYKRGEPIALTFDIDDDRAVWAVHLNGNPKPYATGEGHTGEPVELRGLAPTAPDHPFVNLLWIYFWPTRPAGWSARIRIHGAPGNDAGIHEWKFEPSAPVHRYEGRARIVVGPEKLR
jgi:hypothetical protein